VVIENLAIIKFIVRITFSTDINVIRWIRDDEIDCLTINNSF
jgi:hypothetical protein